MAEDFKIIQSGTHSSVVGDSTVTTETPPAPATPAPAEPASDPEKPAQPQQDTKPEPQPAGNGEPPKPPSAKLESTKKPAESKIDPAPAPAKNDTPAAQPVEWQKMPLKELLKARGFDDSFIGMAEYYQAEGKLDRYIEAMSMDFSKMTPEQGMKYHLQREYPQATPEQLEILYESEVKDRYKLNPDLYDPETKEAQAAKVKLQMDWAKLSKTYSEEMAQRKLPSNDPLAEHKKQQEEQAKQNEAQLKVFNESPAVKSVLTDKKVVLKDLSIKDETGKVISNVPDFNLELADPAEVVGIMNGSYQDYCKDEQGNPDHNAIILDAAFISNRKGFMQALINYGRNLERDAIIEEKHNPPKFSGTEAGPVKESLNEAFGARGKHGKSGG